MCDSSPLKSELERYGLDASELELYCAGASGLVETKHDDEATMARLVRVAATNKLLHQRGLSMLGETHPHPQAPKLATGATDDSGMSLELTQEEMRVLGQYDGGGLVLGIPVGGPFYSACLLRCRSKRARVLQRQEDKDGFRNFILRLLKGFAQKELQREALGLKRPVLTIAERSVLESEYDQQQRQQQSSLGCYGAPP